MAGTRRSMCRSRSQSSDCTGEWALLQMKETVEPACRDRTLTGRLAALFCGKQRCAAHPAGAAYRKQTKAFHKRKKAPASIWKREPLQYGARQESVCTAAVGQYQSSGRVFISHCGLPSLSSRNALMVLALSFVGRSSHTRPDVASSAVGVCTVLPSICPCAL